MKKLCFASLILFYFSFNCFAQEENIITDHNSTVLIANGNKYAHSHIVQLKIESENAYQMMVSNYPDFTGAHWTHFEKDIKWELLPQDGEQTVFVNLRDKDNNIYSTISDKIFLDATPPGNGSVKIYPPDKGFKNPPFYVDLEVYADDAKYMMISNQNAFFNHKWMLFKEDVPEWQLEDGPDGVRKIFIKFRDVAGNDSEVISEDILIDTKAPFGMDIKINDDKKFTKRQDNHVSLKIIAREADFMLISANKDFSGADWIPYTERIDWTLDGNDGNKIIYAKFKDNSGNESGIVSDEIILDTKPPKDCTVLIDQGSEITSNINKLVTVDLYSPDAGFIMISSMPNFKGARWQLYREHIPNWKLYGEENGPKAVYVKFMDEAGNITGIYKDEITLNR
ncbi:MAG: hypothetical protein KTR26_08645 [Flammeovirgaceae bacterium]|nr:hypothetical protein [Flammeovirgaceae bacterium]